jgi:hemoglobin/transferrin/lactoferrin receptor protein
MKIIMAHQLFEESRNDRIYNENILHNKTEKVNAFSVNIDFFKKIFNDLNSDRKEIATPSIIDSSNSHLDGSQ